MEVEPTTKISGVEKPHRVFRSQKMQIAAILALMAILCALWLAIRFAAMEKFAWLNPPRPSVVVHAGPFDSLKRKLADWTGPLRARFRPKRSDIALRIIQLSFKSEAPENFFGQPTATNIDGCRAWIIPREEFGKIEKRITNTTGSSEVESDPMIEDRTDAQDSFFNRDTNIGTSFTIRPRRLHGSVNLFITLSASHMTPITINSMTGFTASPAGRLELACRATVPDGGAIVLETRKPGATNMPDYFMLSPKVAHDR